MKLIDKSALVEKLEEWRYKIELGVFSIPLHGREKADAAFEYELLGKVRDFVNTFDTLEIKEVNFAENEIQPIPLTREILEKSGFVCIQKDNEEEDEYECWQFTEGLVTITYEPNITMLEVHNGGENGNAVRTHTYYTDGDVIYVHELQHLLRMCHINKDIEL